MNYYIKKLEIMADEIKEEPRFDRSKTICMIVFNETDSYAYIDAKIDAYEKYKQTKIADLKESEIDKV